ncbi:GGDEF domain-containing protein [Methylobacterium sp. J-068]|uniref:GGDEF domain-containing protein n=1 Tax=Methylobacterium sp. J-068 TaxID=2836649 RepID=UPI001FBB8EED|nr:GGDEF domain-containing protein [Methylobacterium sp. J-068]MCJ2036712.1 GGDEF domain-containing protein [Methylobacterium sp. J-068]
MRAGPLGLPLAAVHLAHRVMDAAAIRQASDAAIIRGLRAESAARAEIVRAQAALIRSQADALAHDRTVFEQASSAAQIGLWECDLPSETLRWSGGVYDIFEFPRGSVPTRSETLDCYTEDARRTLVAVRADAIARQSSFALDTEIVGRRGGRRWIRITATVECRNRVPVRIFGLKQDITVEKLHADRTRYLAEFDVMTGLANRAVFQSHLENVRASDGLLLVDLDGFKGINDTHGHPVGDACLREAARRLGETCRDADLVARIGGDEFAVLIRDDPEGVLCEALGQRIVAAMRAPLTHGSECLRFGASVGIAQMGHSTPADLFLRADAALYAAKAAGRGTVRIAARA